MTAVASAARLLERIRGLRPLIVEHADATERERRVPAPVIEALADAGVFHLLVPRCLGGGEAHLRTLVEVTEEISKADGSTGWVAMIGATTGITSAYLEENVARAVFGSGPGVITGGVVAPRGVAIPVADGHRVTGRWPFASGCEHSGWLALNCRLQAESGEGGRGGPTLIMMFLPASDIEIIDTWDVSGLRGTGSHDVAVKDVLAPAGYGYLWTDRPRQPGTLYGFSLMGVLAVAVASVAVGIGRGALEDFRELAPGKVPFGRRKPLIEWNIAQAEFAQAEAALRSGRAFLLEAVCDMWETLEQGGQASTEQRALVRLAATAAVQGAVRAVDAAYNLGGGGSIYAGSTLQRRFRDIHTLTQHTMVGPSSMEAAGRALLGRDVPPGFL